MEIPGEARPAGTQAGRSRSSGRASFCPSPEGRIGVGTGPESLRHRRRGLGRSFRSRTRFFCFPLISCCDTPSACAYLPLRSPGKAVEDSMETSMERGSLPVEATATISFTRREPDERPEFEPPFRAQPNTVEDTGIGFGQILDLTIKTIYFGGRPSAREISEQMALPFNIIEASLSFLKREKFIEVAGSVGIGEPQYQYALTDRGNEKAAEALERNQYVGPTPVPFEEYVAVVKEQSVRQVRVDATRGDDGAPA